MNEALDKLNKLREDFPDFSVFKKPRQYAEEIINMKTREERLVALAKVPNEFKDLVKRHVENHFFMRKKK